MNLENWAVFGGSLIGTVSNHPKFVDGTEVKTSPVLRSGQDPSGTYFAMTLNSIYQLGKPFDQHQIPKLGQFKKEQA
jgi:hypothetical protein